MVSVSKMISRIARHIGLHGADEASDERRNRRARLSAAAGRMTKSARAALLGIRHLERDGSAPDVRASCRAGRARACAAARRGGDHARSRRPSASRPFRTAAVCRARRAAAADAPQEWRARRRPPDGRVARVCRAPRRSPNTAPAELGRSTPFGPVVSGKSASIAGAVRRPGPAAGAPRHRRRRPGRRAAEHRRDRRFAHADRPGEAEDHAPSRAQGGIRSMRRAHAEEQPECTPTRQSAFRARRRCEIRAGLPRATGGPRLAR